MTDLDRMKELFHELGVACGESIEKPSAYVKERHPERYKLFEGRPGTRVTVSQAHFLFNHRDEYIGVLSDEMGDFRERER